MKNKSDVFAVFNVKLWHKAVLRDPVEIILLLFMFVVNKNALKLSMG